MNSENCLQDYEIIKKNIFKQNEHFRTEVQGYQYYNFHLSRVSFHVEQNQTDKILYIKDGQILFIDQIDHNTQDNFFITNLDILRFLIWDGQYDKYNKKNGRWTPYWRGNQLDAGGFYSDGLKTGFWIEPCYLFGDLYQMYFSGYYKKGIRQGFWQYCCYYFHIPTNKFMLSFRGGGYYKDDGMKFGKWMEIQESFTDETVGQSYGEYNHGRKIGIWDIYQEQELYFSGSYKTNGKKNGLWSEILQWFDKQNQQLSRENLVYESGDYKDDVKIGKWLLTYPNDGDCFNDKQEDEIIFGGEYDENGVKNGKWYEFHPYFNLSGAIYVGNYNQGLKMGQWELVSCDNDFIGQGSYDNNGNKDGYWKEIYHADPSIIYEGNYKNGKRVGRWNILDELEISGGGKYDEDGMKFGQWLEFHEYYLDNFEIMYEGNYQKNKKIGKWRNICQSKGGGEYNENQLKEGFWIDLSDGFWIIHHIYFSGFYKNGRRIGNWEIFQYNQQKRKANKRGGGNYNEKGNKDGNWIDVVPYIYMDEIKFIKGEYLDGKRTREFEYL